MKEKSRSVKRILIVLLFAAMAIFLTACGVDVDATVKLNRDGSGERIMVLTMPKNEMLLLGKVNTASVDSIIADGCPDCMKYVYNEDDKKIQAEFTLPFSSLEDYQNKLNTFCKKKAEVTAEFDMSPFASEIHYSESVTTKDMLQWIPDLLVEKKVLNNRYRNSVFDQVSTKLYFSGSEYDCGSGRLNVSEMLYCRIDSIDVYTVSAGGEKFTRLIKLNIPEEELNKNKEMITSFLEEAIPEGGFGAWEDGKDGVRIFTVTMQDFTADEMAKGMQKYTGSDACTFENAEASVGDGIFYKGCAFRESSDWTNFGCNEEKTVHIRYYLDQTASEGFLYETENKSKLRLEGVESGDTSYLLYVLGEKQKLSIYADQAHYFHFSSIDYSVDANNLKDIRKTIVFHFEDTKTEDIGEICDKIRTLAKTDEDVAKIQTQMTEDTLTLLFKGTADDVSEMITAITGQQEKSVSYACEKHWIAPLEKCVLVDMMDMEGFVYKDPEGSKYWQIPVNYEVKINGVGKEMISDQPLIEEKIGSFKGKLQTDKRYKVSYRANHVNGLAFLWMGILLLAVVALATGIYFMVRSFIEKRREKREEEEARIIGMGEAKELPDEDVMAIEAKEETAETAESEEDVDSEETAEAEETAVPDETAEAEETVVPDETAENDVTAEAAGTGETTKDKVESFASEETEPAESATTECETEEPVAAENVTEESKEGSKPE